MDPKYEKELITKYPFIFQDSGKPPTESLMCFGIECSDGWFKLLDKLMGNLAEVYRLSGIKTVAVQIKSKFGGLRFYTREESTRESLSEEDGKFWITVIENFITLAEIESDSTCEICGESSAKHHGRGWTITLCSKHRDQYDWLCQQKISTHYIWSNLSNEEIIEQYAKDHPKDETGTKSS